ncbi:MAG: hypothetical protein A2Z99_08570 [Treponema sp. GWB1_62_6]|nr:MAG: hypothetical protein A2001_13180 [Treponema sp. GWC1_61_84]OHE69900.1 MAG: hypothetical protein A2Z99_08570 [Treponema sp. GWB1_62_6]OHE72826.1 MAG: hypothetical protein A2413_02315 [Treponema sp. RIFOXYC1_FULL_61_9]HCM25569.1 hypothetical protein [Treponema sp.]
MACAFRKRIDFLEDTRGESRTLNYLKTKDGNELDFCITDDRGPTHLVEVKVGDADRSPAFGRFPELMKTARAIQLVGKSSRRKTFPDGLLIGKAADFLAGFNPNR